MSRKIFQRSWFAPFSSLSRNHVDHITDYVLNRTYLGRKWWHLLFRYRHEFKFLYRADGVIIYRNQANTDYEWFVKGIYVCHGFAPSIEGKMKVFWNREFQVTRVKLETPTNWFDIQQYVNYTHMEEVLTVKFTDYNDAVRFKLTLE